MSAESEFSATLSRAIADGNALSGLSRSMVGAATQALAQNGVVLPGEVPGYAEYGIGGGGGMPETRSEPPKMPAAPQRPREPFPALATIIEIDAAMETEFPDLTLPTFQYAPIGDLSAFDEELPEVDDDLDVPALPDFGGDLPDLPTRSPASALPAISFGARPPRFESAPELATLDPDVFEDALRRYLALVLGEIEPPARAVADAAAADIERVLDDLLGAADFPDDRTLEDRLAALRAELDAWIESAATGSRSGQPLPPAVRQATRAAAEHWAAAVARNVESALAARKIELREALRQTVRALLTDMQTGLKAMRIKMAEQTVLAHQWAARYAKRVTSAILKTFEAANFDAYDADLARASAGLEVAEAELLIGMLDHELVKARQRAEDANQDRDALAVERLQAESERQDQQVKVFASRVAALRAEQKVLRLPWELYLKKVQAIDATASADAAAYQVAIAQVSHNADLLEGASAALKVHREKQKTFEAQLSAIEASTDARIAANESILDEFKAKVKVTLGDAEMTLTDDKLRLAQYEAEANTELQDARLDLERLRSEREQQDGITRLSNQVEEANKELALELSELQLERDREIAKAMLDGAQLIGKMAEAATSAANSLAHIGQEQLL